MFNNFLNILFNYKKKKMVFLDKNSEKKIYRVLTTIVGLSSYNSRYICKKFGFQKECTFKDLDNSDFEQLKNYLTSNFLLDKLLIEKNNKNVKSKIDLGTYRGKRHNLGYPVRGQRTLSNGKTQRNLHKFRFYYNSDLFSHVYFRNKRKSIKKKKIKKLSEKKNLNVFNKNISNVKKFNISQFKSSGINAIKSVNPQTNKNNNISYLK